MRCITLLFIVLSLYSIGCVQGVGNCPVCDKENCPPIDSSCSHTRKVLDECSCCTVCPKIEGETCGSGNGRCDKSLVCIRSNPWSEEGVCQEIEPDQLECSNVVCIEEQLLECDEGEFYKPGRINNCCLTPGKCVCKRSTCTQPSCNGDELAVMVMPAQLSGACCDSYRCIKIDESPSNIRCTEDSIWDEETQTCECMECDEITCSDGFNSVTQSLGTGEPGNCCDQKYCLPAYNETCLHRGILHFKSERWFPDACHNCVCLRGRTVCIQNSCPPLACPATRQFYRNGECCPDCRDSGTPTETSNSPTDSITVTTSTQLTESCLTENKTRVPVGAEWEDGCQSCTCQGNGVTICTEFSCPRLRCMISIIHPGQCCPSCNDEITLDACEFKNGDLTYEGSVIRTRLLDDMGRTFENEACQNCKCTSNKLECAIGPCNPRIRACDALENIGLDNLPSWLNEYGVVYMFNTTGELNLAMICSYLEFKLISKGDGRAVQLYTYGNYQDGISYFVMTVSELSENRQYHVFKSQQDTAALIQSIHNPSFFSLKKVLTLPELQNPATITKSGHFSTNMLILYSITGAFSTILIIIIMIMVVVSAYTLKKMHRDGALPWQKKRCTTPSSVELNLGTVNRGSQLSPPVRYVEFHTKHSSNTKFGPNTADRSCPV